MKKIVLILSLFLSIAVNADQREYIVGVEDLQYLPFYSHENGQFIGYSADILNLFAKKNNIRFVYKALPIKRLYKQMLDGSIDFKYPDNPNWNSTEKKDKVVFYSQGISGYTDGVIVRNENINKKSLNVLGIIAGFTAWDFLDDIKSNKMSLQENKDMKTMFAMLEKDRIDGAYVNVDVAKYFFKANNLSGFIFNDKLKYTKNFYHLSSSKHANLLKELDKFIITNKSEIEKIKTKYDLK